MLDAVAKSTFIRSKRVLHERGVYISTLPGPKIFLHKAFNFLRKKKAAAILVKPSGTDLTFISDLMKKGIVRAYVEKTFPLANGAEAHKLIETERVRGKLVLKVINE